MNSHITILRNWDDHDPVILGYVARPNGLGDTAIAEHITELWDKFTDTEPDCDTEFIGFLGKYGYTEVEVNTLEVGVGTGLSPLLD